MRNGLNDWLIACYLNPVTTRYKIIHFIHRYTYQIILAVGLCVMFYPIIMLGYINYQNNHLQHKITEVRESLSNKLKLFKSIEQHRLSQYQKSREFAEFDLNIKNILKEHNAEIDYMQWYFEPYKRIEIGLNGYSTDVFIVLNKLHQLNYLFVQEINMTKLYQDRKVQMNASFVIKE